jgi:iron complex outermembrane receptor protein
MPERWARAISAKGLTVTLAGRNLGYLLNTLPNNFNPESLRGTQASQFMIRSVSPYTANFTGTININF